MNAVCANCQERPGTEIWAADGMMAYAHGCYAVWCKVCVLTEQLKAARQSAARIPDLERELAAIEPSPRS